MIFRPWSLITGPPAIVSSIIATVAIADHLFLHDLLFDNKDHVEKASASLKEVRQDRRNQLVENIKAIQTDNLKKTNNLHSVMQDLRMKEKMVQFIPKKEESVQVILEKEATGEVTRETVPVIPKKEDAVEVMPKTIQVIPEKEETILVVPEKEETIEVTAEKEETVQVTSETVEVIAKTVHVMPKMEESVEGTHEKLPSEGATGTEHLTMDTVSPVQDEPAVEKETVQVTRETVPVIPKKEDAVEVMPKTIQVIPEKEETILVVPEKEETIEVTAEKEETVQVTSETVEVIAKTVHVMPKMEESVEGTHEKLPSEGATGTEHLTMDTVSPVQDEPAVEKETVQVPVKEQSSNNITEKQLRKVNDSKITISEGGNQEVKIEVKDKVIQKKQASNEAEDSISYWQDKVVNKNEPHDEAEDSVSYWQDHSVKKDNTQFVNELPEDSISYWKDK